MQTGAIRRSHAVVAQAQSGGAELLGFSSPVRRRLFSGAGLKSPLNHNVAMDEDDHALERVAGLGEIRRVPRVSVGVDIFHGDLAAGLPVIRDEALGLVPREAGIRVLVVVQYVAAALEPDRRRSFDLLTTLETPGTAVAFDQRRKRPLPARPEYAREQRLVAVTEVFDILHVELMGSGFEHCSRHS
jgi:hypothetical protein